MEKFDVVAQARTNPNDYHQWFGRVVNTYTLGAEPMATVEWWGTAGYDSVSLHSLRHVVVVNISTDEPKVWTVQELGEESKTLTKKEMFCRPAPSSVSELDKTLREGDFLPLFEDWLFGMDGGLYQYDASQQKMKRVPR